MLPILALVAVGTGIGLAFRKAQQVYRESTVIGSPEWRRYQVWLRAYLEEAEKCGHGLYRGEVAGYADYDVKLELYRQRLKAGAAQNVFVDDEEKRRAHALRLHEALHEAQERVRLEEALRKR